MQASEYCVSIYGALSGSRIREVEILKAIPPEIQALIDAGDDMDGFYIKKYYPLIVVPQEQIVGIPQAVLITAFAYARTVFYDLIKLDKWTDEQALELCRTSLVLILVGSENVSATNARKRLIEGKYKATSLAQEYHLVNILLSSRLKHHNKSPTLWSYHEHVLTKRILQSHSDVADRDRVRFIEDLCKSELNIVFVSADYHFMNYYAWNHARWILSDMYYPLMYSPSARYYSIVFIKTFLDSMVRKVQKWCVAHSGDSSGWSFFRYILLFYITNTFREGSSSLPTAASQIDNPLLLECVSQTIKFATTVSLAHESIWTFLRSVLSDARYVSERTKNSYVEFIKTYVKSRQLDKYTVPESTSKNDEVVKEQTQVLTEYRDREVCVIEGALEWISVVRHLREKQPSA
ncbi:hypothetical protein BZA70DRAFT_273580 [Myxozyma melibiosi]|uniref:Protein ECM9 n=1 Tax=Myxozyma melibiosi TaxID=54550 RepID=A0ABR1FFW7_9ASCO